MDFNAIWNETMETDRLQEHTTGVYLDPFLIRSVKERTVQLCWSAVITEIQCFLSVTGKLGPSLIFIFTMMTTAATCFCLSNIKRLAKLSVDSMFLPYPD